MKASSVNDIKQELKTLSHPQLLELCLRLARFKKENKELLTYLLFEAGDIEGYRISVKKEIEEGFSTINTTNIYFAKKGLRKVLRSTNKYIRYAGCKETEVDLLICFCTQWKDSNVPVSKTTALSNLYQAQQKKIFTALALIHEDLQHDYIAQLSKLEEKQTPVKEKTVRLGKVVSFLGIRL